MELETKTVIHHNSWMSFYVILFENSERICEHPSFLINISH